MIPGRKADRARSGGVPPWPTIRRAANSSTRERVFSAPGFELVARCITEHPRPDILDLGPPAQGNIEFLSQFSCVVHVGDVSKVLQADSGMAAPEEACDVENAIESAIVHDDHIRFDVVLVWDLFDYFHESTTRALVHRLGAYCRTGTLLYLTTSNEETIPDQPSRFSIVDERHLRFERLGMGTRSGMRHSPRGLERALPGFRFHHSFLLDHQLQEYLFIHG